MTKEQCLDLLQLLSALESWMLSEKHYLPDYLHNNLSETVLILRSEILKDDSDA